MAYVCKKCGKKIKEVKNFVRCEYCGGKVLVKERSSVVREISTD